MLSNEGRLYNVWRAVNQYVIAYVYTHHSVCVCVCVCVCKYRPSYRQKTNIFYIAWIFRILFNDYRTLV